MENFIIMIASLAPGFVGIAVQKLLNGDTTSMGQSASFL